MCLFSVFPRDTLRSLTTIVNMASSIRLVASLSSRNLMGQRAFRVDLPKWESAISKIGNMATSTLLVNMFGNHRDNALLFILNMQGKSQELLHSRRRF